MIALTFRFGAALAILISCIDARAIYKPAVRDAQQAFSTMDVGVFSGIFPPGHDIGSITGTAPPNGPTAPSTVDIPVATSTNPIPTPPAGTGNLPVPTPSEAQIPTSPAAVETPPAASPPSIPIPPVNSTGMPLFPTGGPVFPTGGPVFPTGGPVFPTGGPVFPTGMPAGPTPPAALNLAPPATAEAVVAINTTSVAPGGVFISVPYMTVTVTVTASPACQAPQASAVASPSTPAGIFGPGTGTAVAPVSTTSMPDSSPMPTGAMPDVQPNPPVMMSAMTIEVPVSITTAPVPVVSSLGTGLPPANPQPTPSMLFGNSTLPLPTPVSPPGQPLTPIGTAPGPLRTLTDFAMVTKTIEELAAITTFTIA